MPATEYKLPEDSSLLILDDDGPFRTRLGRAMEQRGFSVQTVESISEARAHIGVSAPAFAVLDMRLEDGSGLDMVDLIHAKRPDCKVVLLTGYGNCLNMHRRTLQRILAKRAPR